MAKLLESISARRLAISFSCYLQPRIKDYSLFGLLKKAGYIAVDFGTDSGSAVMLQSLRKSFTIEDISRTSGACRETGIDFCHSLIFGGPGETPETVKETIRFMDEISPRAVIAMIGIRIYPGTEMGREAHHEGYLVPGESVLVPQFYFSGMNPTCLVKEISEKVYGRINWFFPGRQDWSGSIGQRVLRFFHKEGPLWRTFKKE
ncbi:MAG: radical SAM protein [Dissulfurispiraceae bacterium]